MAVIVLMAYATTYGSTQEVARSVAEVLSDCGLGVEVRAARDVKTLDGYQAVVLGAPLYMFHWHEDARNFLSRYRKTVSKVPVVIFALGPFNNKPEEIQSAREQLDKDLAKFNWLAPVTIEVFPGKFDPARLRFPYNMMKPLKEMPASDERDWFVIHTWGVKIASLIKERLGVSS